MKASIMNACCSSQVDVSGIGIALHQMLAFGSCTKKQGKLLLKLSIIKCVARFSHLASFYGN